MPESNLYLRGEIWWLNVREGPRRLRQSLRTSDLRVAMTARDELLRRRADEKLDGLPATYTLPATAAEMWAKLMKCREAAMRRDRKRNRVATLTVDELRAMFMRSNGKCEATGIPFSLQPIPGKMRRPFGPSLDRLDTAKPYTFDNTRIICVAANIAINEWGESIFRRVAMGFLTRGPATQTTPHHEIELLTSH